ncbi:NGG1p interacting factor NIF3 [Patescibacteria group bacterium]
MNTYKVITYCQEEEIDKIIGAASDAGAGNVGNYSHCAFITKGEGNWLSKEGSKPTSGEIGKMSRERECKVEFVCPETKIKSVVEAIKSNHSFETPQIDIIRLYEF